MHNPEHTHPLIRKKDVYSIDGINPKIEYTMAGKLTRSFAIQNVQTGKNIRPYNSGTSNGNRIVLYDHNEWKCLTYEFIHVEKNIYQLKNLYTQKTFEPSSSLQSGVSLW